MSGDSRVAYLWDSRSWNARQRLTLPGLHADDLWWTDEGNAELDRAVSVEKRLFLKEAMRRLELRDLADNRRLYRLELAAKRRVAIFSAAGNRLAVHEDGQFHFFDVATGLKLCAVPSSSYWQRGPNWDSLELLSPRGRFFAQYMSDRKIQVFDVDEGKTVYALVPGFDDDDGKRRSARRFRFSDDDQLLLAEVHEAMDRPDGVAMFGRDFSEWTNVGVVVWNLRGGNVFRSIVLWPGVDVLPRRPYANQIGALALSPDRRFLAFTEAQRGRTVRLVEIASGTERGQLSGHAGAVADVAFSPDGRWLATGSTDTTVLVWDLNRPLQPGTFKVRLGEPELAAHWKALLQPDAKKADTAIWALVRAPKDSLPYLKKHLRPAPRPEAATVRRLLGELDNDRFVVRAKAEAELERLGVLVLAELELALKQCNALEKQRRLEGLVRKARKAAEPFRSAEQVRDWRALEVLERIGTIEARQLVRELAAGAPAAPLSTAAEAVRARLEARALAKD
jgi:hypothetical protein